MKTDIFEIRSKLALSTIEHLIEHSTPWHWSFTHMINMGNGDRSTMEVLVLLSKVLKAVEMMSGLQQPTMSTMNPPDSFYEERQKEQLKFEKLIKEINIALTGDNAE